MAFWSSNQAPQTLNATPERPKVPKTVVPGLALMLTGLVLNYVLERHNPIKLWENSPYPISWADMYYPPFCVLLSLTGLFLFMDGTFFGRPRRVLGTCATLAGCVTVLFSAWMFVMQFVATGADRLGECKNIDSAANKSNLIPLSKWSGGRRAVGCAVERRGMFLSSYNDVEVSGVTDLAAQQRILNDLNEHYQTAHTHPIQVRFFEQENVTIRYGKDGRILSQTAGPVKLVRVATIG